MKAKRIYVTGWSDLESAGMQTPVKVFLSFHSEEGHSWPTKEQAKNLCPEFDSYKVNVDWAEGGPYVCKDFQVEERSPGQFVLFCEGPFKFKIAG